MLDFIIFYQSSSPLLLLLLLLLVFCFFSSSPLLVVLTIYRTSTASSRSQWAIPQLHVHDRSGHYRTSNCKCMIAVGTPGPQSHAPDRSGHDWTSPASARSEWALDPNSKHQIAMGTTGLRQQAPDRTGHYRTSTASARSPSTWHKKQAFYLALSPKSIAHCDRELAVEAWQGPL